jgi:hypothetical protein
MMACTGIDIEQIHLVVAHGQKLEYDEQDCTYCYLGDPAKEKSELFHYSNDPAL